MADEQQQVFQLQRLYLKDASFECPGAPDVFLQEWKPKVNVQLNNGARRIGEGNEFEVELTVTVTAKDEKEEKTFYLVEVKQAGIFTVKGIEGEERAQLLGAYCPNMLFPYVREVGSDLVAKASFPQMVLQPINFDALYQKKVMEAQAAAQGEAAEQPIQKSCFAPQKRPTSSAFFVCPGGSGHIQSLHCR